MAIQVNAQKKDGYVVSYEGTELKTFYGECVHTAYYDRDTPEREACGGPPLESALVKTTESEPSKNVLLKSK